MKFIAVLASAILLSACSTPYQEMGLAGGVTAQQVTANTYRIVSRGNSYASGTTIQDFTMLKAAETAKSRGATHFAIISERDASHVGQTVMLDPDVGGGVTGSITTNVKPGQDTHIRILTIAPGQSAPAGAVSADEVIEYVGKRVKRPNA